MEKGPSFDEPYIMKKYYYVLLCLYYIPLTLHELYTIIKMKLKLKSFENKPLKWRKAHLSMDHYIMKKILLSFVIFILYPTYLTRTLDYN